VDAEGIQEKHFDMEGVTKLTKENGSVTFFFRGDINEIVQLISKQKVSDVIIEEPTLEEIFMHYYE
jgi:ABC-2 type transport system ATP-binding protein